MKKWLTGAHIEEMRGTPVQAWEYCEKEGKFSTYGPKPEGQGKRKDIDMVRDKILNQNLTMAQVVEDLDFQSFQAMKMAKFMEEHRGPSERGEVSNLCIVGDSGAGKSTFARTYLGANAYWKNNGKWWNFYHRKYKTIIWDDFDPSCTTQEELLKLMQPFPHTVEGKGVMYHMAAENFVFTSISMPWTWFPRKPQVPLLRRLDAIIIVNGSDVDLFQTRRTLSNYFIGTALPMPEVFCVKGRLPWDYPDEK